MNPMAFLREDVVALVLLLLSCIIVFGFRTVALRRLGLWGRQSPILADDLAGLRRPSLMWGILIILSLAIELEMAHLPPRFVGVTLKIIHALLILSVTWVLANLSAALLDRAISLKRLHLPPGISVTATKLIVWVVGTLVLLNQIGVTITPMLTALGVGGLAVSLALQDTLANFFAGMYLIIEQPVSIGDLVKVESEQTGVVTNIGWRTTRLRTPTNDEVILPNRKVAESVLIHYAQMPEPPAA